MREALARSDLDFVVREPEGAARAAEGARLPKLLRMALMSTALVVCAVIVVNALFLQDRRHPAPLLRVPEAVSAPEALAPLPAARPAAPPAVLPVPAAAATTPKAARDVIAEEISRMSGPSERKAKPAAVPATPRVDAERADPIASLIGTPAPPASAATVAPSAGVLAAQKALLRLGYVVRADGMMGATTKQALAHYEADNHLPARGELTAKLARELAAKSGVPAP